MPTDTQPTTEEILNIPFAKLVEKMQAELGDYEEALRDRKITMEDLKTNVVLRIPVPQYAELAEQATVEKTSVSAVVMQALCAHFGWTNVKIERGRPKSKVDPKVAQAENRVKRAETAALVERILKELAGS